MTGEISEIRVTDSKARAAHLLLAFRHGNQQAFDAALPGGGSDAARVDTPANSAADDSADGIKDLVSALTWIANEAVRKAYQPDVADRVLRHLARRSPADTRWVSTEEEAAPDVALLLEAVAHGDTEAVRTMVRSTPDTTFVLGKLLQAVAQLLPSVPAPVLRDLLDDLRDTPPV
ncbi:hypothetical protein [Streptomyces sp. H27-D2]|uniref:hypothetical protein n=1 Tax=Streptomyces sp. H27-D2 TaxID=3046304 RepID=UPI002DBF9808|nr:hypothetical protein [Streptomyces sp. H27-D2]MEC4020353.1 hypothetical protein [Streptomyces sp. H27-D2]